MPNLNSQSYKLSTAIQEPARLKKNKPAASQCLLKSLRAQPLLTLSSAEPPGLPEAPQTPVELSPDKIPSCPTQAPIPHTSKCCSSKMRCDVVFSRYIINCSPILICWTLVLMLWVLESLGLVLQSSVKKQKRRHQTKNNKNLCTGTTCQNAVHLHCHSRHQEA